MATVAVMLVVTAAVTAAVVQWWWQSYRAWKVWGGWCGVVTVQGEMKRRDKWMVQGDNC